MKKLSDLNSYRERGSSGGYGTLLSGHFLGDDFISAIKSAGNEHSYWMCHTGARNIREKPGTPSKAAMRI